MELKDIASVSGKGGLFKVLKPTRTGVILEAIDEKKSKLIAGASQRVSLLKEISIYTTTKEGAVPLEDILFKIKSEYGAEVPVSGKSDNRELYDFISKVVPEYDQEKVYPSDIKKLASWYKILYSHAPEVLEKPKDEPKKAAKKTEEKAPVESKTEKAPKAEAKASSKKTTAKKPTSK